MKHHHFAIVLSTFVSFYGMNVQADEHSHAQPTVAKSEAVVEPHSHPVDKGTAPGANQKAELQTQLSSEEKAKVHNHPRDAKQ